MRKKEGKVKIIFEDDQILVLEKPAGMVVNRAETVAGETLQDWIEEHSKWDGELPKAEEKTEGAEDFLKRSGIVHRLDKETSGILLVAKTPEAFQNLQKQFKEKKVKKKYLALVHGKVKPEEGEISAPVGRLPWRREKFGVVPGGREAVTKYHRLSVFRYQLSDKDLSGNRLYRKTENRKEMTEYSLLELSPQTGRTHQIRVHLKYLGHPIVADEKYAGRKTAREDRKWCKRMFLHASYLGFFHPKKGIWVEFKSKLPEDLKIDETLDIF